MSNNSNETINWLGHNQQDAASVDPVSFQPPLSFLDRSRFIQYEHTQYINPWLDTFRGLSQIY